MANIDKIPKQTIFDILLESSGAISGMFDFLKLNGLEEIEIPEGTYLVTPEINKNNVTFYKSMNDSNNYRIASDLTAPVLNGAFSIAFSNAFNI